MGYKFNFNLTRLPTQFVREITEFSSKNELNADILSKAKSLVKKFKIDRLSGISIADANAVIEDLIAIQIQNRASLKDFENAKKRALLLPHCARKHMDNRCKARFDSSVSSYHCAGCSSNCLVNWATRLGKRLGYDVYVLPGGSCLSKILKKVSYTGIVGVACGDEIRLAYVYLKNSDIKTKGIPLMKNGCAKTKFSRSELRRVLGCVGAGAKRMASENRRTTIYLG